MENPYEAPKTNVETNASGYMEKRSSVPKVVGIIMLVFTVLGILGMLLSLGMMMSGSEVMAASFEMQGLSKTYFYFTMVLGVVTSVILIYISILLIKYRDRGRRFYNYYMIYLAIFMPVSLAYQAWVRPESLDMITFYSSLIGTIVGILIYVLFWYLLNREKVKASLI